MLHKFFLWEALSEAFSNAVFTFMDRLTIYTVKDSINGAYGKFFYFKGEISPLLTEKLLEMQHCPWDCGLSLLSDGKGRTSEEKTKTKEVKMVRELREAMHEKDVAVSLPPPTATPFQIPQWLVYAHWHKEHHRLWINDSHLSLSPSHKSVLIQASRTPEVEESTGSMIEGKTEKNGRWHVQEWKIAFDSYSVGYIF